MEKEMQALKEQAFKAEVAYERRQEAQRRAKQDEAAKRKREQLRIRNELLEAAFDDNMDDVLRLLREGESYFDNVVSSHALPCLPCSGCPNAFAYKLFHLAACVPPICIQPDVARRGRVSGMCQALTQCTLCINAPTVAARSASRGRASPASLSTQLCSFNT